MDDRTEVRSRTELDAKIARYQRKIPASAADVPEGKVVVHNHVVPARRLGVRGFRTWTQGQNEEPAIEVCPCKWAPELGAHFRVAGIPD